jgi:YfaZ precursor
MRTKKSFLALPLCILGAPLMADTLADIRLSDDVAQVDVGILYRTGPSADTILDAGVLYNSSDNFLFNAGVRLVDDVGAMQFPVDLGLGAKFLAITVDDEEAAAIALGAQFKISIPTNYRWNLAGHYYIAPDILTFLDGDKYSDARIGVDFQIFPQAFIGIGYHNIEVELDNGIDATVDEGAHLHAILNFK